MVRKLLILLALISLVSMTRAAPGLADTITLPGGNDLTIPHPWLEDHGNHTSWGNPTTPSPGLTNGDISGRLFGDPSGISWMIGAPSIDDPTIPIGIFNSTAGTTTILGAAGMQDSNGADLYWSTIKITYDPGKFTVSGGLSIMSNNTVITTVGNYLTYEDGKPFKDSQYWVEDNTMIMSGAGTNSIDGVPFSFIATMIEDDRDTTHEGHFTEFKISSDAIHATSAVPIPGAVWLLGSGLFGLACLRPRLRRS